MPGLSRGDALRRLADSLAVPVDIIGRMPPDAPSEAASSGTETPSAAELHRLKIGNGPEAEFQASFLSTFCRHRPS